MAHLGLSEHEREAYSLTRAMRAMAFPHNNEARREAEYEFDVSTEAGKIDNREVQGILIPDDITGHRAIPAGLPESYRALTAGSDTGGGYTVDDELQSIIDIFLENNFASRNVTVMSGLRGNVTLPGQDDRIVASWTTETGTAAEDEPTFRQVTLTPRHCRTYLRVTKQLLLQSHASVEMFLRRDISRAIAKKVDRGLLYGIGSKGETAAYDFDVTSFGQTSDFDAATGKKWTIRTVSGEKYLVFKNLVAADTTALNALEEGREITISESNSVVKTVTVAGSYDETNTRLPIEDDSATLTTNTDYALKATVDPATYETLGIRNSTGIHSFTYDNSTAAKRADALWENVLSMEEGLAQNNVPGALEVMTASNCSFLLSPRMKRYMKQVKIFGANTEEPLLSDDDMILDYPVYYSTNVNMPDFFFCDWKDTVMGIWSGIEIMENPYSEDKEGIIRFTADQMIDVNVLRPKSLSFGTSGS